MFIYKPNRKQKQKKIKQNKQMVDRGRKLQDFHGKYGKSYWASKRRGSMVTVFEGVSIYV